MKYGTSCTEIFFAGGKGREYDESGETRGVSEITDVMAEFQKEHPMVRYCGFKDQGMILGYGCGSPEMTKRSRYVEDAYLLGKRLYMEAM